MSTVTLGEAPAPEALDAEERMSRDELEALQLQRLKQTVSHAYANVELYRQKFDAHEVHPDDLVDLSDLEKFPFTTKEDLRRTYPYGMFAVPMERVSRIHASSGTTGIPTVVGYTKDDLGRWATLVARSLRAGGIRPGTIVQNSYGYGLFTGGLGAHAGAELLGCTVIPMSGGNTAKQLQSIRDFRPGAILCTPTYLLTLADALEAAGVDPRDTSLQFAVLGAEPWSEQMRAEIEGRLNIHASDIYGLSEVMGPGVASECVESKKTARTSGKTTSVRRSSTVRRTGCWRMAKPVSWCSPRSPRRPCPSSGIALVTSRGCFRARRDRGCAGCSASVGAMTT